VPNGLVRLRAIIFRFSCLIMKITDVETRTINTCHVLKWKHSANFLKSQKPLLIAWSVVLVTDNYALGCRMHTRTSININLQQGVNFIGQLVETTSFYRIFFHYIGYVAYRFMLYNFIWLRDDSKYNYLMRQKNQRCSLVVAAQGVDADKYM
jgi:hypothetical protein